MAAGTRLTSATVAGHLGGDLKARLKNGTLENSIRHVPRAPARRQKTRVGAYTLALAGRHNLMLTNATEFYLTHGPLKICQRVRHPLARACVRFVLARCVAGRLQRLCFAGMEDICNVPAWTRPSTNPITVAYCCLNCMRCSDARPCNMTRMTSSSLKGLT